jgi:hypothetical protein
MNNKISEKAPTQRREIVGLMKARRGIFPGWGAKDAKGLTKVATRIKF